jgi:hypothetical protein
MKDYSKAEYVSLGTLCPLAENLRGYIPWGPALFKEIVFIADVMGHSEVNEHWSQELVLFFQHNVI